MYLVLFSTVCLLVQTASSDESEGTLEVIVNGHTVSSGNKTQLYRPGEVVVDKCFASLDKIDVRNPSNDGWAGSFAFSNDGGASYFNTFHIRLFGRPLSDDPNRVSTNNSTSGVIEVDGDKDVLANVACSNGATCELLLRPGLQILRRILLSMYFQMCMYVCMCITASAAFSTRFFARCVLPSMFILYFHMRTANICL